MNEKVSKIEDLRDGLLFEEIFFDVCNESQYPLDLTGIRDCIIKNKEYTPKRQYSSPATRSIDVKRILTPSDVIVYWDNTWLLVESNHDGLYKAVYKRQKPVSVYDAVIGNDNCGLDVFLLENLCEYVQQLVNDDESILADLIEFMNEKYNL